MPVTDSEYEQTRKEESIELGAANGPETEEHSPQLSHDNLFAVLANPRRRAVIRYLRENDGEATVRQLAEWIAAEEEGKTVQELTSSERKRVYVGLYQNHLPMMDDVHVVDYDDNRKTVELRETVTQLEPYLDGAEDSINHLAVGSAAIIVATGIVLGALQVGAFGVVALSGWIGLGLVTLVSVTVADVFLEAFGN